MRAAPLLLGLSLCAACSAGSGNNTFPTSSSGSSAGGAGGGSTGSGGDITIGTDGGSGGGGGGDVGRVYAHSASTLYELNPITKAVTTIGDFKGCSSVWDIAVDKDGVMFATTQLSLYRIDTATATCTHVAGGLYPNSLSFVPKGTVDPNVEALVGYEDDVYVRIDPLTGAVNAIGALGAGYASSGDIVSVIGGGTYLTVKGNGCQDCIVEVDPIKGTLKKMIGPLGHASVFGLAFWAGSAYGFDDAGNLFQIDLATGKSTSIAMPNPPPGLSFWGAGSTTAAPLEPPH